MTLLVAASRVHVEDRGEAETDGMVDLSLLMGRTIRMSHEAACEVLETTRPTLRKLVSLGVVRKGALVGHGAAVTTRWILLDPADTRRSLYDRWVAALGTPRTHYDFDRYRQARDACVVPGSEMPPQNVVDGMLRRLLQIGGHHPCEIGAFTQAHPDTLPELRKLIWKDAVQRVPRGRWGSDIRPTDEMVLLIAPGLRGAPGTVFEDLLGGEDLGRPKEEALRMAWRMGPLRQAALLWSFLAAATYRRPGAVQVGVRKLRQIDELLMELFPGRMDIGGTEIAAALDHMAFSPDVRLSRHTRFTTCRDAMVMLRQLQLYARANDRDGTRGIARMVPSAHPNRLGYMDRLKAHYADLAAIGRGNRKRSSDKAAARYEELCEIAALRHEQAVVIADAASAAAERLLARPAGDPATAARVILATKTGPVAQEARRLLARGTDDARAESQALLGRAAEAARAAGGNRDETSAGAAAQASDGEHAEDADPWEGFSAETTVMSPKGQLLPGSQICHGRAWRERDFWIDLARQKKWLGSIEDEQLIRHLRKIVDDPDAYPDVVFEWRGCTPLHRGLAIDPWFVTISNMGVLVAPGSMTVRQRRRRHQHMITWKLPAYNGSATGLLNFGKSHGMLWRWANERNRHIVPIEQFAMAMRFVHLAFAIADETMCRVGELLQIRQDRDAWPIDRSTGTAEVTFLAIPKTSAIEPDLSEVRFPVSQQLFVDANVLARDVAILGGNDGVLPEIAPARELSDRRTEHAAWIFQFNGRALHSSEMNRFLAFLFGNVADITFHDIRHASANAAREAGVPEESVQAMLNHRKRSTAQYYMRRNRRQRTATEKSAVRRRKRTAAITAAVR